MADEPKGLSSLEEICIGAAVIGVVAAVVLWILIEHPDEANHAFTIATGKVMKWLD